MEWSAPAFNPQTDLMVVPAVIGVAYSREKRSRASSRASSSWAGLHLRPAGKIPRLAHGIESLDRRGGVEVSVEPADAGRGDGDLRQLDIDGELTGDFLVLDASNGSPCIASMWVAR
jgi:hypothetical protein